MGRTLAERATLLGGATVEGLLFDLGNCPGALRAAGSGSRVKGELYKLHRHDTLTSLDAYEGCGPGNPLPHVFQRRTTDVRLSDGGTLRAWIYWYCGSVRGADPIPSGDYLGSQLALQDSVSG